MYRSMRSIALVSACASLLLLAGCGNKAKDTAPLSFAPEDTPYLYANFEPLPDDVAKAWRNRADALRPFSAQSYQRMADVLRTGSPELADELQAVGAELQSDKSAQQLVQHTGLSPKAHIALYGIGIVPVLRFELSDPQAFRAFIARVEKRVGHPFKTAELDGQKYWVNGYGSDKLNFLLAIEGDQAVATLAPADADPALLKQLLGLTKPEHSAADRLSNIDGAQGYTEYGSGYLDLPKLLARLSNPKDPVTLAYATALGAPAPSSDPSCPAEFASIGAQMPLASFGYQQFEADHVRGSLDISLSAPLRGLLANLKQPVPGMAAGSDDSLFDLVLAFPLQKVR
ncbi:MAG TPA: hypothetical protein VFP88_07455, partial [Rhodanobacteraceae bacterium]|nr:hypothetical protein [Rhodanobacteraceae bacterium]